MTLDQTSDTAATLVEHYFRHESGKIVSHLTRIFGTSHLELIEDAVQDALVKAMQVWSYSKTPDNPSGWLLQVARNKVLDQLRRATNFAEKHDTVREQILWDQQSHTATDALTLDTELSDDVLRMMFACCHPQLSPEQQIILTLKILCGFSKTEMARALLKSEDAVAKAYTRGRAKLQQEAITPEVPIGAELSSRLDTVAHVLYLLFNEGYNASHGEKLIRRDLCDEAIRLCELLLGNKVCSQPNIYALASLMYMHVARFDSREDAHGRLLTLEEQDRSLWDSNLIRIGLNYFADSAHGVKLSEYHLLSGILYEHCIAPDYEATNWENILRLYDLLFRFKPSPIVALNRVVALSKVQGAQAGLAALETLADARPLQNYYLYYAIKAELYGELAQPEQAVQALTKAIGLTDNQSEQQHLQQKLELLAKSKP